MISLFAIVFITMSTIAVSQPKNIIGNCYTCNLPKPSENWTQRQKQERGMIPTKKYTTCRLKKRIKSRPTRSSIEKRLSSKKHLSDKKKNRKKPDLSDY